MKFVAGERPHPSDPSDPHPSNPHFFWVLVHPWGPTLLHPSDPHHWSSHPTLDSSFPNAHPHTWSTTGPPTTTQHTHAHTHGHKKTKSEKKNPNNNFQKKPKQLTPKTKIFTYNWNTKIGQSRFGQSRFGRSRSDKDRVGFDRSIIRRESAQLALRHARELHFPDPVHLPPMTKWRERALSQVDEGYP